MRGSSSSKPEVLVKGGERQDIELSPVRNVLYWTPRGDADELIPALSNAGWNVRTASDIRVLRRVSDVADFPIAMARLDSLNTALYQDLSAALLAFNPKTEWLAIVRAEVRKQPKFLRLIQEHFCDFHTYPVDIDRLLISMGHAYGMAKLNFLESSCWKRDQGEPAIFGQSQVIKDLNRKLERIALSDASVLITGESGTGKGLVAQALHARSPRRNGPFIAVNCAAFPTNLVQSELFGYEKGAFTGAYGRKPGKIELAEKGTIFLDEIGDIPLEQQVNLLRVLEDKMIERIGGTQPFSADVRVIAATHCDLKKAVAEGRFRLDLYYRLKVLVLKMPALRERGGDILLLAEYYFHKFANERGNGVKGFSSAAIEAMNSYHWPGNVRELINRVRSATVMCEDRWIYPCHLGLEELFKIPPNLNLNDARARAEKKTIMDALSYCGGNISKAAFILEVSRRTLYRLIEKHAL